MIDQKLKLNPRSRMQAANWERFIFLMMFTILKWCLQYFTGFYGYSKIQWNFDTQILKICKIHNGVYQTEFLHYQKMLTQYKILVKKCWSKKIT